MENNKEVKNIADHQEQHPIEGPPPQESSSNKKYPVADNPLQPPELQRLPVEGRREEKKTSLVMGQVSGEKPEEYCCCAHGCLRGLEIDSWCTKQCGRCCFNRPCVGIFMCMVLVICICRNGCRDRIYK